MKTVYDAAGGLDGLLKLASAWHTRVLEDEVVSHAFSHGYHPQHTERLASYWAEALGGPTTYSDRYGDETSVVRIHSGNGLHEEMDQRAIACFDQALDDVGLAHDERLRRVLHDYFAWATTTTMARYHHSAEDVPDGVQIPKWSWHGLVSGGETAHRGGPLMDAVALVLEHSVEAEVSRAFAWKFRTNVATWNDPPATFVLDGAFTDGSQGSTVPPGQTPLTWWIRDVHEERSFAIEMLLDRATLRFEWYFDVVGGGGTKLTQRIVLSGTNAPAYREQVEAGFRPTLADGMRRLAADMVAAQRGSKDAG